MKNFALKLFFAVLTFSLLMCSFGTAAAVTEKEAAEQLGAVISNGTVLIDEDAFIDRIVGGAVKSVSVDSVITPSVVTFSESDGLPFDRALSLEVNTVSNNKNLNFNLDSTKFSPGDVLLLKYTARAVGADGKLGVRFYNTSALTDALSFWGNTCSADWTTYYFPCTAVEGLNQLRFRVAFTEAGLQTIQITNVALINFGSNLTVEDLPSGSYKVAIDTSVKEVTTVTDLITNDKALVGAALSEASGGTLKTSAVSSDMISYTNALSIARSEADASSTLTVPLDNKLLTAAKGDLLSLTFYAKGTSRVIPMNISTVTASGAKSNTAEFFAPTGWSRICVRFTAPENFAGITFDLSKVPGEVLLTGFTLTDLKNTKQMHELPSGQFLLEDFDDIPLDYSESGIGAGKTVDLCTDGEYIYSIGQGTLKIYSIKENKSAPTLVGSLSGLGTTRQIALTENKDAVVITSRQDGMFIVDVTDKANPALLYAYDAIEFATGLAVCGDYAYVTCRVFGTEIIDISDYENPRHVSVAYSGEAQSCVVSDGYLYAGCWGDRKVEIFDVRNPAKPVKVTELPVSGKGDGLAVKDNYIYVATGHAPKGADTLDKTGFALGNGMDIYDITDITSPKYVSTVKIDDHFYKLGEDYWTVRLSGNTAYLTNSYNGIYAYDVTDPAAPVRLGHITVRIPSGSEAYTRLKNSHGESGASYHFPYDTSAYLQSPVGNIVNLDGYMYIAGSFTDIHVLDASAQNIDYITETEPHSGSTVYNEEGRFYDFTEFLAENPVAEHFEVGGQVYAAVEKNGYLYLACGNGGIKVCDSTMKVVSHYRTDGTCYDVKLHGDKLYAAVGMAGLDVYDILGSKLSKLGNYISYYPENKTHYPVRQVVLSPNANFAMLSISGNLYEVVDLRNLSDIKRHIMEEAPLFEGAVTDTTVRDIRYTSTECGVRAASTGLTYYRNITHELIANRYLAIYWHLGNHEWVDFGTDDGAVEPKIVRNEYNVRLAMPTGHTGLGEKSLTMYKNGYILIDPTDETFKVAPDSPTYIKNASGGTVNIAGKPVTQNGLLVISHRYYHTVDLIDIRDIENPVHISKIDLPGNPDNALITDKFIYIPYGNAGILRLALPEGFNETPRSITGSIKLARADGDIPYETEDYSSGLVLTVTESGKTVAVIHEKNMTLGNADGKAVLGFDLTLPAGSYECTIRKNGYAKYSFTFTADSTESVATPFDITLTPGDIKGDYTDFDGDGIVDIDDFVRLLRGLVKDAAALLARVTDVNEDGVVSIDDILLVKMGMAA